MTFNCPHCGAPGKVFDGLTTYGCQCRFGTYKSVLSLTEEDIRRIVREELRSSKSLFEQVFGK